MILGARRHQACVIRQDTKDRFCMNITTPANCSTTKSFHRKKQSRIKYARKSVPQMEGGPELAARCLEHNMQGGAVSIYTNRIIPYV